VVTGVDSNPAPHAIVIRSPDAATWRRDPDPPVSYSTCTQQGCLAGGSGMTHSAWVDLSGPQPRFWKFATAGFDRNWAAGDGVICHAFGDLACTPLTALTGPPSQEEDLTALPSDVQPPTCIACPSPVNPPGKQGIKGTATLRAVIQADGHVGHIKVEKATDADFAARAVATVQNWTFHPAIQAGKPIALPSEFDLTFNP